MTQWQTNMTDDGYLAFCAAWSCCFSSYQPSNIDRMLFSQAVRAGIVFG